MKTITATALVALMTTTIGLTSMAPSFAQDTAPAAQEEQSFRQHLGPRDGGLAGFFGFERGAEAVEIAFVRLSHAIELTAEQQPLFDAFRTAALSAATELEASLDELRPAAPAEGVVAPAIDFADRIDNRIAVETARLAALEAVRPAAVAFFDSLTDEQKTQLMPRHPEGPGFGKGGPRHLERHHNSQGSPRDIAPANG